MWETQESQHTLFLRGCSFRGVLFGGVHRYLGVFLVCNRLRFVSDHMCARSLFQFYTLASSRSTSLTNFLSYTRSADSL